MSNEIDLEQFIQVLDHALATDDPKIKKALRKFLFIAALAMDEDPEPGPFTAMFEEMDDLRNRIKILELKNQTTFTDNKDYWYGSSTGTGSMPTWITGGGTSTSSGTVTISPTTTTTSTIYGPGSCTGFTGYTINLGDDEKGKRIKQELEQKLGSLNKSV